MAFDRWARLFTGLWLGALLTIGLIATPAPFATLAPADAGRVVSRILAQEAYLSLLFGLVLLMLARRTARLASEEGRGSQFSTDMALLVLTLICTIVGYFGVQPLMSEARAGRGAFSFGQLHMASAGLFVVKTALVAALAWRAMRTPSTAGERGLG